MIHLKLMTNDRGRVVIIQGVRGLLELQSTAHIYSLTRTIWLFHLGNISRNELPLKCTILIKLRLLWYRIRKISQPKLEVYMVVNPEKRMLSKNTCSLRKIHLGLFPHKNCYKLAARGVRRTREINKCWQMLTHVYRYLKDF